MPNHTLQLGLLLLAWGATCLKLAGLRRGPGNPALRWHTLGLLALALALTLLFPPVYLAVDRLIGVPNLALALGHGLLLVAAFTAQAFFLHLTDPGEPASRASRRRAGWLAAALTLMVLLFALAPVEVETVDVIRRYASTPFVAGYWLIFLAYLAFALYDGGRMSWRYSRLSDDELLRLGLRLGAAGGLVGLAYVAHEILCLAARLLDLAYPLGEQDTVARVLLAGMYGLIVVGSTLPAWGPRVGLTALWRQVGRFRAYRRLYPLWRALYESDPGIALLPPSSPAVDALAVWDLRFRLYRRIIEIRDGRLALRPYLDPRAAHTARELGREAGLPDEELEALAEAASLAAALRAKARDRPVAARPVTLEARGGADLDGEVAWLRRVTSWFADSPLVTEAVLRLEREQTT